MTHYQLKTRWAIVTMTKRDDGDDDDDDEIACFSVRRQTI